MVLIALGGNMPVNNRSSLQILRWAIGEMKNYQIYVTSISSFYGSKPVGQKGQSDYVNAVVSVRAAKSAANLLKNLKLIEKAAGRDFYPALLGARWGARPLDLDLVDYKGVVSGNFDVCSRYNMVTEVTRRLKSAQIRRCELVLPHPRTHLRPFVLRPILDIAPLWHHPVTGLSALSMWSLVKNSSDGAVLCKVA